MVCLIYTPSALRPAALMLWVYISGKPLLSMLQLLNKDFSSDQTNFYIAPQGASSAVILEPEMAKCRTVKS